MKGAWALGDAKTRRYPSVRAAAGFIAHSSSLEAILLMRSVKFRMQCVTSDHLSSL